MVKLSKYVLAAIIALNVAIIVFSTVSYFDSQRLIHFNNEIMLFMIDAQDMQNSFLELGDEPDAKFCSLIDAAYTQKIGRNDELAGKMVEYEQANLVQEFNVLKRQFLLSNLQLYRLSQLQKRHCSSSHTDVLFVYSSRLDCYECQVAGNILTDARKGCNARVFVTDIEEKENLVSIADILDSNNITSAPSFIIGDKVIEGVINKGKMREMLNCG